MGLNTIEAPMIDSEIISEAFELYDLNIEPARRRFSKRSILSTFILDPKIDPKIFEFFLIYFNGLGVGIAELEEDWFRRAADRCDELGYIEEGAALRSLAKKRANQYLLMIQDTQTLAAHWNSRRSPKLEVPEIIGHSITEGAGRFIQLIEGVISSDAPYAVLAAVYELEKIVSYFGPLLLEHCLSLLGGEVIEGTNLVQKYSGINTNAESSLRKRLGSILVKNPDSLKSLVQTSEDFFEDYDSFLGDCLIIGLARSSQSA